MVLTEDREQTAIQAQVVSTLMQASRRPAIGCRIQVRMAGAGPPAKVAAAAGPEVVHRPPVASCARRSSSPVRQEAAGVKVEAGVKVVLGAKAAERPSASSCSVNLVALRPQLSGTMLSTSALGATADKVELADSGETTAKVPWEVRAGSLAAAGPAREERVALEDAVAEVEEVRVACRSGFSRTSIPPMATSTR